MSQKQPLKQVLISLTLSLSIYIYITYERADLPGHKRRLTDTVLMFNIKYLRGRLRKFLKIQKRVGGNKIL